ncbi:MAG: FliM/FliN family flagellar motor switch protein [Proteobacteria bacterium]|nr:FliM/FliN family flagellar motor switch protein [Pseudomonadota bacterium]
MELELEARLGRGRMTLADLAGMKQGAIVTLDTPLNGQVELIFNEATVARGEIVAVGDQLGLRITDVFAREE